MKHSDHSPYHRFSLLGIYINPRIKGEIQIVHPRKRIVTLSSESKRLWDDV